MAFEDWVPIRPGECALCGRSHPVHVVLTLKEFCERYRLSRGGWYTLKDKPTVMRVGQQIRITLDDALEWERRRKVQ